MKKGKREYLQIHLGVNEAQVGSNYPITYQIPKALSEKLHVTFGSL